MVNHANVLVVLIYPIKYQNFDIFFCYDDALRLQFLTYQRGFVVETIKIIACTDLEGGDGEFSGSRMHCMCHTYMILYKTIFLSITWYYIV